MPVFSKIASFSQFRSLLKTPTGANVVNTVVRGMSDHGPRTIPMVPTRFQWHKFKDMLHYYLMVGAIPVTLLILYTNIFIGPAQLTEIPEDYVPKHWEYHRHPITRFMARHFYASPQQDYEKMLHLLADEQEKMKVRQLEKDIHAKMADRKDYQAYYYRPALAKYHRVAKKAAEDLEALAGDN
ncbi:CLUMA_CG003985, isoform A [Clunio marinus]|uniref:NADH dehydrogenase [ubiquinone] 1 beta subcomplex subunit 5, mitochondrial n=1 Tax=Clunio marinus TaxID=568069 RepID=A0A1J1HW30_9DIPT|nr:CLUMA_CG003985, isoform A [Clunio marinus]